MKKEVKLSEDCSDLESLPPEILALIAKSYLDTTPVRSVISRNLLGILFSLRHEERNVVVITSDLHYVIQIYNSETNVITYTDAKFVPSNITFGPLTMMTTYGYLFRPVQLQLEMGIQIQNISYVIANHPDYSSEYLYAIYTRTGEESLLHWTIVLDSVTNTYHLSEEGNYDKVRIHWHYIKHVLWNWNSDQIIYKNHPDKSVWQILHEYRSLQKILKDAHSYQSQLNRDIITSNRVLLFNSSRQKPVLRVIYEGKMRRKQRLLHMITLRQQLDLLLEELDDLHASYKNLTR